MKTAPFRKTPTTANFAHTLKMGELAGATFNAVENLHLLRELIDRRDTGEPLQLSFTAANALTRLLDQFASELCAVSDTLADT